jgi:hypothetical protein
MLKNNDFSERVQLLRIRRDIRKPTWLTDRKGFFINKYPTIDPNVAKENDRF